MNRSIVSAALAALAACSFVACANDYDQFDLASPPAEFLEGGTPDEDAASGDAHLDASAEKDADASSESDVASAADAAAEPDVDASEEDAAVADAEDEEAAGDDASGGDDAADAAEEEAGCSGKMCGSNCVTLDDPATGCADPSCTPCAPPNATASCQAGACAVSACDAGFADCNGQASDGCETNVASDPLDCGACGAACPTTGGTPTCTDGVCGYSPCPCAPGTADCNGTCADACETDTNGSTADCGFCGHVCAAPHATPACTNGSCTLGACDQGYADCDALAGDGCEVATSTDTANCGACGNVCPARAHASTMCAAGTCGFTCTGTFVDCDGNPANGCEVDTNGDVANCGGCGKACSPANATGVCSGGTCSIGGCASGFSDCDGSAANGCEVSLGDDPANCGACGRACSGANVVAKACSGGVCTSSCQLGYANCAMPSSGADDGCERAASTNATSCGGCGNDCTQQGGNGGFVCGGGSRPASTCGCTFNTRCRTGSSGGSCNGSTGLCSCSGDTCRPGEACARQGGNDVCSCNGGSACSSGQTCCESPAGCKDLDTDPASCGACGHACAPGFACSGGACGCTADAQCDAGGAGTCGGGVCHCGATTCAAGQRCLAGGACG